MEGILTCPMPVFREYRPNPGIDRWDNYDKDMGNGIDVDYGWLYSNSIIYELLCIICFMRPIQMYCFSAEPYA